MHPKLWQAVNVDIFELEDSHQKGFLALYMEAACKLASCSCFLEGTLRRACSAKRFHTDLSRSDGSILAGIGSRCRQSCTAHNTSRNHLSVTWKLGTVLPSWKSDPWSRRGSVQVRTLAGTNTCHHDGESATVEWFSA